MKIEVSIIIINFNTYQLTCECIESILDKTKGVSYEVILVDNGSVECDPDLFKEKFPDIKLIKSKINLGFAKGNNLGIENAKGDVILLLNSDTVLENDAISICYKRLVEDNRYGLITSKLIYPNGDVQRQCRKFETISMLLMEQFRIHKLWSKQKRAKKLLNGYFDHQTEIETDRIWGAFFMFKRDILDLLPNNKLADTFFMYGEDNEWCYQIRTFTPYKVLYYPKAVVIHKIGGSNFGAEKNKVILNNKHIYMSEYYGSLKSNIYFFLKRILTK